MDNSKTGGAAFPRTEGNQSFSNQTPLPDQMGMSLLDYFAAKAMQGMYQRMSESYGANDGTVANNEFPRLAEYSYAIAAAMIEERKKYM